MVHRLHIYPEGSFETSKQQLLLHKSKIIGHNSIVSNPCKINSSLTYSEGGFGTIWILRKIYPFFGVSFEQVRGFIVGTSYGGHGIHSEIDGSSCYKDIGPDHQPQMFSGSCDVSFSFSSCPQLALTFLRLKYFKSAAEIQQWREDLSLRQVSENGRRC